MDIGAGYESQLNFGEDCTTPSNMRRTNIDLMSSEKRVPRCDSRSNMSGTGNGYQQYGNTPAAAPSPRRRGMQTSGQATTPIVDMHNSFAAPMPQQSQSLASTAQRDWRQGQQLPRQQGDDLWQQLQQVRHALLVF